MTLARADFYRRVPTLLAAATLDHGAVYDELLYTMRHPIEPRFVTRAARFRRRTFVKEFDSLTAAMFTETMDGLLYPDLGPLAGLGKAGGIDFPTAVRVLHFHQPSYPILDETVANGLARLGVTVEVPLEPDASGWKAYTAFQAVVDDLKTEIPYTCVPESHFYLARIVEGALWALGREAA